MATIVSHPSGGKVGLFYGKFDAELKKIQGPEFGPPSTIRCVGSYIANSVTKEVTGAITKIENTEKPPLPISMKGVYVNNETVFIGGDPKNDVGLEHYTLKCSTVWVAVKGDTCTVGIFSGSEGADLIYMAENQPVKDNTPSS